MVWRIHPRTQEREEISTKVGDIWQDDRRWKIRFLGGVYTASRQRCEMLRRQMLKDGLSSA